MQKHESLGGGVGVVGWWDQVAMQSYGELNLNRNPVAKQTLGKYIYCYFHEENRPCAVL